ncbi:MAG TPA: polymer-forming cytoskeletal protein [bacterium]|jgi:cytoskeletal protein CcmA (bactofilin family)|nr:polymer-forming cytoskeletal protein [bacterium]
MFGMGSRIDTVLGQGAEFRGNISVDGGIVVDGKVEGNINATERITVGAHGSVRGNLYAPEVVLGGKVQGQVTASGRAELLATAQLEGDVRSPKLVITEGALLSGKVGMEAAPAVAEAADYKFARK